MDEFFRNAPPRDALPADTVKLMRSECAKWHPDKICMLFRGQATNEVDRIMLTMITDVAVKVKEDAGKLR